MWINGNDNNYNFSNCQIKIENVKDVEVFNSKEDNESVTFLDGGIKAKSGKLVAQAGDVVQVATLKKLVKLFEDVDDNTKIMTIRKIK